jgi:ribose/xylose/arabinose/galactoside ABC-type transport system permease subunit
VLGLVFVFGLFSILRWDTFATAANLRLMLLQAAVVGVAALGMTLVIVSGGIDLSVGANIALCTVVIAQMLSWLNGSAAVSGPWQPIVAASAGILASSLIGLVIGLLVTFGRLMPFIVTLAMWGGVRGLAIGIAGGGRAGAPDSWLNLLLSKPRPPLEWVVLAPGVWITIILAIMTLALLRYTRFGRHIFAVGSNEMTARLCGVRVDRTKIGVYLLAGAFAGAAGVLEFSYLTTGDPTTAQGRELDVIAAVVIGGASLSGGRGSVIGTLIGAMIMKMVESGCLKLELDNWVQQIVTGGIIVLAVSADRLRRRAE